MTTIAHDLPAAFAALHLDEDPLEPAGEYFTGQTLLEYLDERHQAHGLPLELMDKLVAFYRRAMVDWRTPLADGHAGRDATLSRIALRHAVATDDAALVGELAAAGRGARRAAARQRDRHRPGARATAPTHAAAALVRRRRAGGARCARLHRQRGLARARRPAAGARRPAQRDRHGRVRGLRRAGRRAADRRAPMRAEATRTCRRPIETVPQRHAGRTGSVAGRGAHRRAHATTSAPRVWPSASTTCRASASELQAP